MTEIKKYIDDFIDAEYQCNYSKWDIKVTNEQYENYAKTAYNFMNSIISDPFGRAGVLEDLLADKEEELFALKKLKKIIPRTLFQIKQYQNPNLGDALQRIVTSNDIWACYVSASQKYDYPIPYGRIFYISETKEGLKIIDYIYYSVDKENKWDNPADRTEIYQISKVISPGTLVAVEKYLAPEDEICLNDYNKQ